MTIRGKSITAVAVSSLAGTTFLWVFNIFYVLRDWSLFWDGFSLFMGIVAALVAAASLVLFFFFRTIVQAEKVLMISHSLEPEEGEALDRKVRRLPLVISLINLVGFFLGPLLKQLMTALAAGSNPFNLGLLTSILYSVSIGFYVSFIEIRLLESFLHTLQLKRNRSRFSEKDRKSWKSRQMLMGFSILTLAFGLFFSAGKGYLTQELLAPAALDGVTSASETHDARSVYWSAALEGNAPDLTENDPYIMARQGEFYLKMFLLGLVVSAAAWLAITIEAKPTETRLREMNSRLRELAEGDARQDKKLVIVRDDELGETVHWINSFIDRQSELLDTIRNSIGSLASISNELYEMDQFAQSLGEGISSGVRLVQDNLGFQRQALEEVKKDVDNLSANIRDTASNIREQNDAMSSNSTSVEEMTASIGSVSKNAQGAFDRTQLLKTKAEESSLEMQELMSGIQDVVSSAEEVGQSVGQIGKIAAQTNLLAMNAAIEAAHAGDVGAGFAVVASEVRKLAEDSSVTTKRISELIGKMNEMSQNGLIQVQKAQDSFGDISENVRINAELMAEISQSMKEQESGSREMQSSMERLDRLSRDVLTITGEQEVQSGHVEESMEHLNRAANAIQEQVDSITDQINQVESFISSLNEIIKRNSTLVKDLKSASGLDQA